MSFVQFWDMCSGGKLKEKWDKIYIKADSVEEAEVIFYNRFGHDPQHITCSCCGEDYSISIGPTLFDITEFDRKYKHLSLDEYLKNPKVLVLYSEDITPNERLGSIPRSYD